MRDYKITRKHSNRMRTAYLLTISHGIPGPMSRGRGVDGYPPRGSCIAEVEFST